MEEDKNIEECHLAVTSELRNFVATAENDEELLLKAIMRGNNRLTQQVLIQQLVIDDSWIDTIENALFSVEQIVKKPKTFIKDDRELVNVEKARRVDSVSIRHLASHTENVRRVNEMGRIEPSKVLARFSDEELATYENRVVYTLIQRLKYFIENKYQTIKDYADCFDINKMQVNSAFKAGKCNVKTTVNIEVSVPSKGESVNKNMILLQRLAQIRERIMVILGSDFCLKMQNSKPVHAPIMKTNLLRGNTDYNNCYNLWLFITSFTAVGFSVEIKDKILPFDDDYFDDLAHLIAESVEVMLKNNALRDEIYNNIPLNQPVVRKYNVGRKINLVPDIPQSDLFGDDEAIGQFYYENIKKLTKQIASTSKASDWDNELNINPNFRRFFKGLQKINNSLYGDILRLGKSCGAEPKGKIEKARRALKIQQEEVEKEDLIIKLKKEDLLLSEKRRDKQLEKMRFLDRELEREIKRAEKIAKEKQRQLELEKKRKQREKERLAEQKRKEIEEKKEERKRARLEQQRKKQILEEKQKALMEERAEKERAKAMADKEREKELLRIERQKQRDKEREKRKKEKLRAIAEAKKQAEKERERERKRIAKEKEAEKQKLLKEKERQREKEWRRAEKELRLKRQAEETAKLMEAKRLEKQRQIEELKLKKAEERERARKEKILQNELEKEKRRKEREAELDRRRKEKIAIHKKEMLKRKKERESAKKRKV